MIALRTHGLGSRLLKSSLFRRLKDPVVGWMVLLLAVRVWLATRLQVTAFVAPHDDLLFVFQAGQILNGDWLGLEFSNLTLAKGPMYPLFIAACSAMRMPLILSEQLFYLLACALFVRAVRPWFTTRVGRLFLLTILVMNPMTMNLEIGSRVLREGIYPALTLIVFGCAAGVLARLNASRRARVGWGLALGCGVAAFWLTREEGVWLLPSLGVLVASTVGLEVDRPRALRRVGYVSLLVCAILFSAIASVEELNRRHYGLSMVNEFKSDWFSDATRTLQRVEPASWRRYVLLPAEARSRVYDVSPKFRELKPFLEGALGRHWIKYGGCPTLGLCDDLAGGWLFWAMRDAVERVGYYDKGEFVAAYYRGLADEVAAACDSGRLACRAPGISIFPPWHHEYAALLVETFARSILKLASFEGFTLQREERAPLGTWKPYFDVLRDEVSEPIGPAIDGAPALVALNGLATGYEWVVPPLAGGAGFITVYLMVLAMRRRQWHPVLGVILALGVAIVTRLVMLSIIDVTLSPSLDVRYLAPLYPMLLAGVVLAIASLLFRQNSRPSDR